MSAYKKILIAVDVCDDYQEVIKKALKLADDPEWLHVVHVVEPIYYPENYMGGLAIDFQEKTVSFAKSELDEIATKHAIPPANRHILIGKAATSIHVFSEENAIDLIIVGSHGKHGLQLLLGSTATAILHGAKCDVLAVRIFD